MTLQMAFTFARKSLRESYQFLKYASGYLRKGRYAPESKDTEPYKFGNVKAY